jgi:hypothetical protein
MADRIIRTPEDLDLWIKFLLARKLPITVSAIDGADRTGQQNRLQWLWASEAAHQRGDMSTDEVQREWKLRHGVPILREQSPEFREFYDQHLKRLTYPQKLEAMRFVPITSEMRVKQMVQFMDTVQRECAEQGIKLTDPDPDLAAYQARYRPREKEAA